MTYEEALYWHTHNGATIEQERQSEILIKKALEKQIPKKPIRKNPICYEKRKDGTELFEYDYFCPDCNEQIKANEHHCECGQALDWSIRKDK